MTARENNGKNGQVHEQDSTEVDPCLSQPSKQKSIHDKWLTGLQLKTGLTRSWVLVLGSLVLFSTLLFTIIVALAVAWPHLPHMLGHHLCSSPACLEAAAQIQENLNSSVSLCTNPWQALCSKYTETATPSSDRHVWNQKEALMLKELEMLRDVISTFELPLHTGTIEWKMKHFYEACMDVDTISTDGARLLTNMISELGGWHILRDWNEADFNGMEVLTKLQVLYGVSSFFRVHVEPNPMVPDTNAIRISPSGLGLPDKDFYFKESDDKVVTAYMDFIRDVVISLSLTRNEAAKFGKDIFNYEKRLAEITPDLVSLQDPLDTYSSVALDELKLRINTIPFFDILQEMYPEVAVTESTEVLVTSEKYLSQLAQIISSTDRRMLNGYLIWTLVRTYLPFLSDKYTSAMDSFNFELFGTLKSKKRWEICAGLVREFMPLAAEYHLEQVYPISQQAEKSLNKTFKTILRVITKKVETFKDKIWLVPHLTSKLNGLKLHVGLPKSSKYPQFLKDFYAPLKILKLNWFEGARSALGLRRRIEEKMLLNSLGEWVLLREMFVAPPRVGYVPSMNTVTVPRSLMIEPYSDGGYPRPVTYGRLGTEMATAIVSSVLPHDSLWTSDRKLLSPFHKTVNQTFDSVRSSSGCLSRRISTEMATMPVLVVDEVALRVVKQLAAVKVATEALMMVSSVEEHTHYSGLEQYEEAELFFISYAQTLCGVATKRFSTYETETNFAVSSNLFAFNMETSEDADVTCHHLSCELLQRWRKKVSVSSDMTFNWVESESRLDLVWTESPEFREAFDCPKTGSQCFTVF